MSRRVRPTSFYAVRTTARQELNVALLMEMRAKAQNIDVASIIVPPGVKGYVIIEAPGIHIVYTLIRDLKHVKGQASGSLTLDEVERAITPKSVVEAIRAGELVDIVAGPFRGMKAQVVRVDKVKNEVVLNVLESSYPLQITVPGDYIKPARKTG